MLIFTFCIANNRLFHALCDNCLNLLGDGVCKIETLIIRSLFIDAVLTTEVSKRLVRK